MRQALVQAIAQASLAFISFGGDIVYNGYDKDDWKVWDSETAVWREKKIPVYPVLGNHDLHGDERVALGNYFQRRRLAKRPTGVIALNHVLDNTEHHKSGARIPDPRSGTGNQETSSR